MINLPSRTKENAGVPGVKSGYEKLEKAIIISGKISEFLTRIGTYILNLAAGTLYRNRPKTKIHAFAAVQI